MTGKITILHRSLAFFLALLLFCPGFLFFPAQASYANEAVKAKLDTFIQTKYPEGSKYTASFAGATQCYGFAKEVIHYLFGKSTSPGKTYRSWTYAGVSASGMKQIGQLGQGGYSSQQLKNLLAKAWPGDVLQLDEGARSVQHSMIVYSVGSSSFTVYDANGVDGKNTVYLRSIGYGEWANGDNAHLTLLRSENYESLYGAAQSSGSSSSGEPGGTAVSLSLPTQSAYKNKYFVTDTNACPVIQCKKTAGAHVSTCGIRIHCQGQRVHAFEMPVTNVPDSLELFHIWFDLNKECGITLQPAMHYQYQFFAVVDGQEYSSEFYSLTTTGERTFSIQLDPQGGTVSPSQLTVTTGQPYGALPTPQREGYTFQGWYMEPVATAAPVTESTLVPAMPSFTIYAHWKEGTPAPSYDITLHVYVDGEETEVKEYTNKNPNFRLNLEGAIPGSTLDAVESNFAFTREGDVLVFQGITGPCTIRAYFLSPQQEELPSGLLQNFVYDTWAWEGYADVSSNQWYYSNVRSATRLGLMQGAEANRFYPNNQLTVAEMLALACRVHLRYHTGQDDLPDTGGPWYEKYVDYALEQGLIDQTYTMDAPADRDLFALVFSRVLPSSALEERNPQIAFQDLSSCQHPQAVELLGQAGIIVGSITEKGRVYQPANPILRSEAAAIITRIADRDLRQTI